MRPRKRKDTARRFTVSLPDSLFLQLEKMVEERGFQSRSQAISEMISETLTDHHGKIGNQIMAGTITLIFDHRQRRLQNQLTDIQHKYLKEIISVQLVHLENHHTLQILLIQGPGRKLKRISDELITCKGVQHGKLQLSTAVLPQLH